MSLLLICVCWEFSNPTSQHLWLLLQVVCTRNVSPLTLGPLSLSAGPQIEQSWTLVQQGIGIFNTDPVDVIHSKLKLAGQLCQTQKPESQQMCRQATVKSFFFLSKVWPAQLKPSCSDMMLILISVLSIAFTVAENRTKKKATLVKEKFRTIVESIQMFVYIYKKNMEFTKMYYWQFPKQMSHIRISRQSYINIDGLIRRWVAIKFVNSNTYLDKKTAL